MKKLRTRAGLCLAMLALLAGGCVFFDPPEAVYYDLTANPLPETGEHRTGVGAFRNDSGSGSRLRTRRGTQIAEDGAHKWVLPPAELVERTLRLTLPPRGRKAAVRGELLEFEYNADAREFRLAADYRIDDRAPRRFRIGVKSDGTPEGTVGAASEAVRKFAAELDRELR